MNAMAAMELGAPPQQLGPYQMVSEPSPSTAISSSSIASEGAASLKIFLEEFRADLSSIFSSIRHDLSSINSSLDRADLSSGSIDVHEPAVITEPDSWVKIPQELSGLQIDDRKHDLRFVGYQDSYPSHLSFPIYDGCGDLSIWKQKADDYFSFHHTPVGHKVTTASFHLQGVALNWYWNFLSTRASVSWSDFLEGLETRFGSSPSIVAKSAIPVLLGGVAGTGQSDHRCPCPSSAGGGDPLGLEEGSPFDALFAPRRHLVSNTREAEPPADMSWRPLSAVDMRGESKTPKTISVPIEAEIEGLDCQQLEGKVEDGDNIGLAIWENLLEEPPSAEDLGAEEFVDNLVKLHATCLMKCPTTVGNIDHCQQHFGVAQYKINTMPTHLGVILMRDQELFNASNQAVDFFGTFFPTADFSWLCRPPPKPPPRAATFLPFFSMLRVQIYQGLPFYKEIKPKQSFSVILSEVFDRMIKQLHFMQTLRTRSLKKGSIVRYIEVVSC